jgi:hypothetical protein
VSNASFPPGGFDTSQVSPSDAAVTLLSFPRRFKAALTLPESEQRADDVVHRRPRGGGLSGAEHAAWTATAIQQVASAFWKVINQDNPEIQLPPVDVEPPVPGGEDPTDALVARIEAAASPLADRIGDVHGNDWTRTGRVDSTTISALDVIRHAVRVGVEHLHAAERTVADVAREVGS